MRAVFFAVLLGFTAFLTGNAVQANTVADQMQTTFGFSPVKEVPIPDRMFGAAAARGAQGAGREIFAMAECEAVLGRFYREGLLAALMPMVVAIGAEGSKRQF